MVWVARTLNTHLVPAPLQWSGTHSTLTMSLRTLSDMVLSTSRDEASIDSLVNIFQCPTALTVKNFPLIPNQNLFSFSLKPLSLFLWLHALVNSLYLFCRFPPVTGRPPWSFFFSSWVNLILSAFPPSRGSSSLWSACWPPLDFLQQIKVLPVLVKLQWTPNKLLHLWSHLCRDTDPFLNSSFSAELIFFQSP